MVSNQNTLSPVVELQRIFARTEELCGVAGLPDESSEEVRELLRRAKELAAELTRENERLRMQNLLLERQKLEAEQRLGGSKIGKENEQLKTELRLLGERMAEMEREASKYRRRYEEAAQHNSALANMFVAATRLHSTLDFAEVVQIAEEILWDIIASPVFAIFAYDSKRGQLILVGGRGVEERFPAGHLPEISGLFAEALESGGAVFESQVGDGTGPLACIPLRLESGEIIGIIAVYEIEKHKRGVSELDRMLFEMLASQMATAIMCSRIYSEALKKLKSMESFINLIKPV